jgi:minichromosome maintenance protein 10
MADEEDDIALLEEMLLSAEKEDDKEQPEKQQESVVRGKKNFFLDDSSDEEETSGLFTKYNEFGSEINKKLKQDEQIRKYESIRVPSSSQNQTASSSSKCVSVPTTSQTVPQQNKPAASASTGQPLITAAFLKEAVFCDPVFGLRIVNPMISSAMLKERMEGKMPVGVQRVRFHTERGDKSQDWVIAGVLVGKSAVKQTHKGDQFSIWTISDLKGEIKLCTLFLFRSAHKELWKNNVGIVIAALNPNVLERKDEKVEACLSVDNAQKVMVLGQSKDYGTCKAKKNNGDPCGQIVNKTDCDVCIFHMKREYGKFKRSDLQLGGLGRGLQELRNKVLGKSEVFYAGQSFSAQKAKKPVKQMAKDRDRLMTLSEYYTMPYNSESPTTTTSAPLNRTPVAANSPAPRLLGESSSPNVIKRAVTHDNSTAQRKKDIERLRMLQGTDKPEIVLTPKFQKEQQILKAKESPAAAAPPKDVNFVPKLTNENITFSFSMPAVGNDAAKRRAAEILKKKPLEQSNPNSIKYRGTEAGKKRIAEDFNKSLEGESKKAKVDVPVEDEAQKKKDFIKRMMNAKSSHADLGESLERDKQQKCFDRLEKKEAMEERMASTTEMKVSLNLSFFCQLIKTNLFPVQSGDL